MTSLRIIWQFRLKRTSGGVFSNLLPKAGSALMSDQVAQDIIQSGLENLQGRVYNSGQPAPLFGCCHSKKVLSYIVKTSCVSTVACCQFIFPPWTPMRSLAPSSQWPLHRYCGASIRSRMTLFSRLDKFSVSSISPHKACVLALNHVGDPLQMSNLKC